MRIGNEINNTWQRLLEGGSVQMPFDTYEWSDKYGWLRDRYGVNWQLSLGRIEDIGQKFTPVLMFTEKQHGKALQTIRSILRCLRIHQLS
jgi:predicted 3-demethylubiquinone-9 3-methyltransferase (glyoxalase superfamily)